MKSALRWMCFVVSCLSCLGLVSAQSYLNMEVSHVHPIVLTDDGQTLVAVNTPGARLEVYSVAVDGSLTHTDSVAVGLEPVSVTLRNATEAWVVNNLSDTISIVDLSSATVTDTLPAGDEPTDVAFAANRAFVSVSGEDKLLVYELANLALPPQEVEIFSDAVRALATSPDGTKIYAVPLRSGNQTTIVNGNIIDVNDAELEADRLTALGLNTLTCASDPPPYPPLPAGITRNPALTNPPDGVPKVALIVQWNEAAGQWQDDAGQNWNDCLPFRLPDRDLFIVDAATLAVTSITSAGTILFDVSVQPGTGNVYVPNTEARNLVRFEHPLGVQGHVVDNRLSVIDVGAGTVNAIDLNAHINRTSDPTTNLAERQASVSQPGMMVWSADGSVGYMTAIGSRKIFRIDGTCTDGTCIFGSTRATPDIVEVGEGPTGVALLESANRLFVLNRFTNSIATVDTSSMTKLSELDMLDPSSDVVLEGRRFLYDGILSSGHGDAACSSCHISGDLDALAWDLGNPEGDFVPYGGLDNVRFVEGGFFAPDDCVIGSDGCNAQDGFDPQKGPMTTQSLRGMLEPLHWRGDRATMNSFNGAFVDLLGAADISPLDSDKAGLSTDDMEAFRQFMLGVRFPPNPFRNVDDSLPNVDVSFPDRNFSGNPTAGENVYMNRINDGLSTCRGCHALPFGTAGGALGGIVTQNPALPTATALFNGDNDKSLHSDLEIAHLRNMYVKLGPTFGDHVGAPPEAKSGFGFSHDGSVPNLGTFFSVDAFNFPSANNGEMIRDVAAFMLHFPSDLKPAVGQNTTVPAGPAPTGTAAQEALISTLITVGDTSSPARHCDLTVSYPEGGRVRHAYLSAGQWVRDVATDPAISTAVLRQTAGGPLTFLCGTIDSGPRLGSDRDEDTFLDGDDCAPNDSRIWGSPGADGTLRLISEVRLTYDSDPSASFATEMDVAGDLLTTLRSTGTVSGASCLAGDVSSSQYDDLRPPAPSGDGHYYLVRGRNICGVASFGAGRESLDGLACP